MRAANHADRVLFVTCFRCNVIFYNCRKCGGEIFTEQERKLGWCGCGMIRKKKPKSRAMMTELQKVFDENHDPYAQVMAGER